MSSENTNQVTKKKCPKCQQILMTRALVCPIDKTMLISTKDELSVGSLINGQFELIEEIGKGGMSEVFKAKYLYNNEVIALKLIKPDLITDATANKRFTLEGNNLKRMNHPNLVKVYDVGACEQTSQLYIAMEFIEGIPLNEYLKKYNNLSYPKVIKLFTQICEGLRVVHDNGIIHRDLKPGNIILIDHDYKNFKAKIVDFGIAKFLPTADRPGMNLTQTGDVFGTPIYMSPEQCQGEKLDFRSDIYSLGVVIYETLIGRVPFKGKTIVDTMQKHCHDLTPYFKDINPNIEIPAKLEGIVRKCLAKSCNDRYNSVQDILQELTQFEISDDLSIKEQIHTQIKENENKELDEKSDKESDKKIISINFSNLDLTKLILLIIIILIALVAIFYFATHIH